MLGVFGQGFVAAVAFLQLSPQLSLSAGVTVRTLCTLPETPAGTGDLRS